MLRGTVVSGKIIKFDRGKIGIIFGKSLFLFMFKFNKFETHVIRGEEKNLKITYKNDLEIIPVTTVEEVLRVALVESLQSIDWDFSDYENSENLKGKKSSEVGLPNWIDLFLSELFLEFEKKTNHKPL